MIFLTQKILNSPTVILATAKISNRCQVENAGLDIFQVWEKIIADILFNENNKKKRNFKKVLLSLVQIIMTLFKRAYFLVLTLPWKITLKKI